MFEKKKMQIPKIDPELMRSEVKTQDFRIGPNPTVLLSVLNECSVWGRGGMFKVEWQFIGSRHNLIFTAISLCRGGGGGCHVAPDDDAAAVARFIPNFTSKAGLVAVVDGEWQSA